MNSNFAFFTAPINECTDLLVKHGDVLVEIERPIPVLVGSVEGFYQVSLSIEGHLRVRPLLLGFSWFSDVTSSSQKNTFQNFFLEIQIRKKVLFYSKN